jgi:putative transposase
LSYVGAIAMKKKYHKGNHSKYMLKVHIIFVCKYRKKLLAVLGDEVKNLFFECSKNNSFVIDTMECDVDHIHLLIDFPPKVSVKEIVRKLKSYSTVMLWKTYSNYLSKEFWVEHTFWSNGYFACTIGDANEAVIRSYIQSQG